MPKTVNKLDSYDLAILQELQKNARMPNSELATRVGLSTSASLARTNRLRQQGVIKQFTAIIDFEKVGINVIAFTFVSLSPHTQQIATDFAEQIAKLPQVMESYNLTGSYDYMLKIVSPDIPAYRQVVVNSLLEIEGVSKVETMMALSIEKQQYTVPLKKI